MSEQLQQPALVEEEIPVKVLVDTEASFLPDEKSNYPLAGTSIYSAILSRNEAVKDAKRLKTFLELRDKYVQKNVVFEDPLFPANDSSLYFNQKLPMKIEWKRPSVSLWFSHFLFNNLFHSKILSKYYPDIP